MVGINLRRSVSADGALWVDELGRGEQFPTFVTLVTFGLLVAAVGTSSNNESVGESHLVGLTVHLLDGLLLEVALLLDLLEQSLHDLAVL